MLEQFVVVVHGLPETESGVQDDVIDAAAVQFLYLSGKILHDFHAEVDVKRVLLHVRRSSLHVHHDIGDVQAGYGVEHPFVQLPGRDVVDDGGSVFFHAHGGRVGTECVYGKDRVGGYRTDDSEAFAQPGHLLFRRNVFGPRAGRVCPDVYDVRTLVEDLFRACGDVLCRFLAAYGIKGIRGQVEDPHDSGSGKLHELAVDRDGVFRVRVHYFISIMMQMYIDNSVFHYICGSKMIELWRLQNFMNFIGSIRW